MKKIALVIALLVTNVAIADQYVRGYTKSNGTSVDGYYRSSPNNTVSDNFSTRGNTNPYTGASGTVNPSSYGSSRSNTGGFSREPLVEPVKLNPGGRW